MPIQPAEKYWDQINNKEEEKRKYKLKLYECKECGGNTYHENTGGNKVFKYCSFIACEERTWKYKSS